MEIKCFLIPWSRELRYHKLNFAFFLLRGVRVYLLYFEIILLALLFSDREGRRLRFSSLSQVSMNLESPTQ